MAANADVSKDPVIAAEVEEPVKGAQVDMETFEGMSEDEMKVFDRKLTRKLDLHLLALLVFLFVLNILDRQNIAAGRLGGLDHDLGMTDTQYQTAVAIMYVGYLGGQMPSNLLITRVRPTRYLPFFIVAWGLVSLCTAWVRSYAGMMVARVCLGLAESPFFPGALLLMSSWYPPTQFPQRVAIMYCGNTIANAFGGLLAAGVLGGMDGLQGIAGWRWLYILEGSFTMLVGAISVFRLADFPNKGNTRWLSEQEHRFAIWRMTRSAYGEVDENGSLKQGVKDALTDPNVYLLLFTHICVLTSSVWTAFFPTIMKSLGYTRVVTLLLTAPVYVFGFITALGNSFYAGRSNKRAVLIIWPLLINVVGISIIIGVELRGVRYFGMFLMCTGSYAAFDVMMGWISATVPRSRTKRSFTFALINSVANLAHIYGAYFFPEKDAPQFVPGGAALIGFAAAGVLGATVLAFRLKHINKKTTQAENEDGRLRYKFLI